MSQTQKSREKRIWIGLASLFIVLTVVAGSVAAYYYYQYSSLKSEIRANTIEVNLGYGVQGHQLKWSNISVSEGTSLYGAMVKAGWNVNYTSSKDPLLGIFVTGINGIQQNTSSGMYWTYWIYTGTAQSCWFSGPSAANFYLLAVNKETVVWYLSAYNATTQNDIPPPC
ncbi:MAG: hypothetical protein QW767_06950 [Thermoprotei archaeon]